MKKFIDKESGRIVSLLTVEEAKKVLKMYINYCLGKQEVKKSRLNLVEYLGDFVNYSEQKDISRFYDILNKEKEGFQFSKSDVKAYESLMSFFEIYNKIENNNFELSAISNYITSAISKKTSIDKKVKNGEELNFEEKLNNIFFNKGFDLSILAKNACAKWEEGLRGKIEQSDGQIDVSLQEEIAYQELLELCTLDDEDFVESTIPTEETIQVQSQTNEINTSEVNEDNNEGAVNENTTYAENVSDNSIISEDNTSKMNEQNNPQEGIININEEENQEVIEGPIIINNEENNNAEQEDKAANEVQEDDTVIKPSDVKQATEDVTLRDAADFFNGALDGFTSIEQEPSKDTNSQGDSNSGLRSE